MDLKEYITSEKVRKRFKSQFDMVNYAIKLAANMISTGRDCRVKTDSQSRAIQVLNEILNNKDHFDEIIQTPPEEILNHVEVKAKSIEETEKAASTKKIADRKNADRKKRKEKE